MTVTMHPLFDLAGKVGGVTGGGPGLGQAFCSIPAELGAGGFGPDLRRDRAEATCEMIKEYGHRALPMAVDTSKYDQVKGMFQEVEDTFGRLDVLVNNAGILSSAAVIHEMSVEDW